jgi:hypothetical protein
MKLHSSITRIFTLGLIMAFTLPLAAKPGPLPSWITPPPPGAIVTQALVNLKNPITGEIYTVPTGGYTVNISDSDAPRPGTGGPDPRPEVEKPEPRPKPRPFPPHWGRPPAIQTKDIRPLPGGFGQGSSTLAGWIDRNIKSDLANSNKPKPEPKRPPVVRPPKPPRPELSDETKVQLAGIESDKKALMEEMKAKLATLEKDASKEDARKAVEEFKKDNEARFAAIKEAAGKVHEELKAKRPERKERPEPPAAVKAKIAEVKKVEKTLHVARKAVSEKLKEAQDELAAKIAQAKESADKDEVADNIKTLIAEQAAARKAALDEFRAAQKEKHEELKAAQKELRKEVRNTKEEGSSRTSR